MTALRPDRTLGSGHDEFWHWCAKGQLRLPRCDQCGHLSWPVTIQCDCCGGDQFAWQRMSGTGKIISWCTFERDYYQGQLQIPWDTILVELDEGPLFLSNPLGFTWREIEPDMSVRLAFLPAVDSAGKFELPVFERTTESNRD